MNKKFLALMFMMVFVISFASAAKPVTIEFVGDSSLIVHANPFDYYAINTAAELHFHVLNKSNGALMTPTITDCEVELVNSVGTVVLEGNPVADGNHFKMMRNSSIVTETGIYGVSILCNSSGLYGIKTTYFEATETGDVPAEGNLLVMFILLFFIVAGIAIYAFMWVLNRFAVLDVTLNQVVLSYCSFGIYLVYYYFAQEYLLNAFVTDLLLSFLWVCGFINLFVVMILFVLTLVKNFGEMA